MKAVVEEIKLSDIVFDEGLYPRVEGHDPGVVQSYARDMEQIEASGKFISVKRDANSVFASRFLRTRTS